MKWFDETAYDETTGEGTIAFLEAELDCLQPGDEVLHNYAGKGFWVPATVECVEEGNIYILNGNDLELVRANLARTTRLPKGFLIPNTYHLQHYSAQLLAQEQNNGTAHPPPSKHTSDYRKFFLVYVVILLHGEFAGQDVPHRSLKHRTVNDLLSALPMECLALHEHSKKSTKDGMWVKDIERNIGDLRWVKGQLKKFKGFGELADVVPRKTIRWVGSEEAYQAILDEFRIFRARIPEFKIYTNHDNEEESIKTKASGMSDSDLGEKLDAILRRMAEREAKEEEFRKQTEERAEQHRREMSDLSKKVDQYTAGGAAANTPLPPDQSKEFKADLKAVLQVQIDEPYDVIFTTEIVAKSVAGKWAAKTDHLGFLQIDAEKNIRTNFRDIVYAALMEMWHAKEIQRLRAENPAPEPGQSKVNDWFWSVLKNPVHCI